MSSDKSIFQNLENVSHQTVKLGDDRVLKVAGSGTVPFPSNTGEVHLLKDVQFVPQLDHNLLSVGQLMNSGYDLNFSKGVCTITNPTTDALFASVHMTRRKLFPPNMTDVGCAHAALCTSEISKLWHLRYRHLNMRSLQMLNDNHLVEGLPCIAPSGPCEGCSYGKQIRSVFPTRPTRRASAPLALVHADLMGPMQTPSLGGNRYIFLLTDDYTRYSWVHFIANKADALECFKSFQRLMEKQLGHTLRVLRTDRGGEFISKDFDSFCNLNGIKWQLTAPYSPQQNGVAERKNRTVMEMACSMMKERNVPTILWAEAVSTAVYILNRSPCSVVEGQTPYEALRGEKPLVKHFRVFGCVSHVLIEPQFHQKLDSKTHRCVFIGYCEETKGYKLFDPVTKKVKISRNVKFFEDLAWNWSNEHKDDEPGFVTVNTSCEKPVNGEVVSSSHENLTTESTESESTENSNTPTRYRTLTDLYDTCTLVLSVSDPTTFEEAVKDEEWKLAVNEEHCAPILRKSFKCGVRLEMLLMLFCC